MKQLNLETGVGVFLVVGFLSFAYIAIKLGGVDVLSGDNYALEARFGSVSGLKVGADIEIAGVKVGKVANIMLDPEDGSEALVQLVIDSSIRLESDSIASIRTAGIIGDRYISIAHGGADDYVEPNGEIIETESAINLEELVSKYIFEK